MIANTINAEFYKQFSKKSSFILPIITFILFLTSTSLTFWTVDNLVDSTMSSSAAFWLLSLISILMIVTLICYFIIVSIIPIVTPISIFSQDYSNNVIAYTISSGGKRANIFWVKYLVAFTQIFTYFFAATLGIIISYSIYMLFGRYASEFNEAFALDDSLYISTILDNVGITLLYLLGLFLGLLTTTSIAILSITLTKNFVAAFFTTLGFLLVIFIITSIIQNVNEIQYIETDMYGEITDVDKLKQFLITDQLINIFIKLFFSITAMLCALLRFVKTDY